MLKDTQGGAVKKIKDGKEYWWCKEHRAVKGKWFHHNTEDISKQTSTSSSSGGSTKPPSKEDRNKNMTLTKEFKAEFLDIKEKSDAQSFLFQLNINAQGNK